MKARITKEDDYLKTKGCVIGMEFPIMSTGTTAKSGHRFPDQQMFLIQPPIGCCIVIYESECEMSI